MHAAKLNRSDRLKKTLTALVEAGSEGATTAEIQHFTKSMATATDISELRQNGWDIPRPTSEMRNGRRVFRYVCNGRLPR